MKGLVVIIGANGKLGKAFTRNLPKDCVTIGTTRGESTECNETIYTANLFLRLDLSIFLAVLYWEPRELEI